MSGIGKPDDGRSIACLVLIGGVQACMATPSLDVQSHDVQGTTRQVLRESMAERGPMGDGGARLHAYTRWFVRWNCRLGSDALGGRSDSLDVSGETTMILPRWERRDQAPPALRREWQRLRYVAALQSHEQGHHAHGVAAAEEIRRRLGAVGRAAGCDRLKRRIAAESEPVLVRYRERDLEYDASTDHGATQGARI